MTLVLVEEVQTVDNPCVETAADVLCDFLHDVTPILEPQQL